MARDKTREAENTRIARWRKEQWREGGGCREKGALWAGTLRSNTVVTAFRRQVY